MHDFIVALKWTQVAAFGLAFFATIYLLAAILSLGFQAFLQSKVGRQGFADWLRIDPRPVPPEQYRREWCLSALSIVIFGLGLLIIWALMRLGVFRVTGETNWLTLGAEILALMAWNEVHFYANHRALHHPALRRFHLLHHKSITPTVWSTYSFHPLEAMMLGSVLLLPMWVWDFSFWSLLSVPILSLLLNSLGHSNFDYFPSDAPAKWWQGGSLKHEMHHRYYHGNYGFILPFLDKWCGTEIRGKSRSFE